MPVNNLIQLRKGSSSTWSSQNPVLSSGEPGYDLTNNILKVGDGVTPWNNLSGISTNLDTSLAAGSGIIFSYADSTLTISTSGGGGGGGLNNVVEDITPQLGGNLDLNSYSINGTGNISISGNIIANTGSYNALTVNSISVSVSGHTHTASDITNFNEAVDDRVGSGLLVAGTGVGLDYNDNANTLTINVTNSPRLVTTVFNNTGSTIPKFRAVYINGGQGDQPTITLAANTGDATSAGTYGVTSQDIDDMSTGEVVVFGALTGINTDQFNPSAPMGDVNGIPLYLGSASGNITSTKPYAPNHIVTIGTVVRTHQNEGVVEVRIINGFELEELHDVAVTGVTNGQFLQYNSSNDLWIPSSSGNFTTLQLNGTTVSVSGHTHTSSDITNFNSSVSGLLPVKNIIAGTGIAVSSSEGSFTIDVTGVAGGGTTIINPADNRILTSDGTSTGINAESNLIFDGTLLNVSGSGTFASGVNISNQTGSTIASFDANKNIISLTTATYPSLTELSYVKGVTSAIQTQIGTKANSSITMTAGSGIAGGGDLSANRSFDIGQGDGITVNADSIAVDSTVIRTTGTQTITGNKTISVSTGVGLTITNTGTSNSFVVNDESSDTTPFIIDAAGNVGIGSTSPTTLLHILGTGEGIHSGRVGGGRPHLRLQHANGTVASRTISANGNYVGQVSFEGYNGTSYMEHTGIFGIVNGTVTTSSIPTDLVFSAGSSGNTASNERMRITSAGSVGIGTTSPATRLHVAGTSSTFNGLLLTTTAAGGGAYASIEIGTYYPTWTVASPASLRFIDDNNFSTHITFRTKTSGSASNGDVERFRITSAGNTEIRANAGNVSSAFTYNENGGELVHYDETQTAATLLDQTSTQTRLLELINGSNLVLGLGGSNTTGSIVFVRAGYNEAMRIDSTGAAWMKTTRAWNDAVPTLNIGNDGDGRLQTRHIWGKAAGGTGTEHLWLQFGNSGYHVQVGNAGQNTNLYVGQDLAVGAYFSGGTAGILGSSGYVYGKRFYNIDAVSTDTGFGLYFNGSTDTGYAIYREAGAWTGTPYPDLRIAFHTGIKIGANATYNGVRFYTDYDMSSQVMSVNNASDGLGAANVYVNNSLQAGSSLRAPIFYDSNDTNYYLDPNGTSVLNRVNPIGWDTSGRNYSREWIELPNFTGLLSGNNGAYFYPNNASYGAWRIAGTRNGWAGLEFDSTGAGNVSLMMNSGHTGVHNNTYGWQWYWTGGKFYVSAGANGGGTMYPVVTSKIIGAALFGFESGTFYLDTYTGAVTSVSRVSQGVYQISYAAGTTAYFNVATSTILHSTYAFTTARVTTYNAAHTVADARYITLLMFDSL